MARVPLQPPAYVKLDVQSRELRGYASVDSPLFSLELDGGDRTASDDDEDDAKTFLPLSGAARKAALPMIAISAMGWTLFVLGFGIYRNRYTYVGAITDYPELYWAWTASTVGPVVYVLALVHAFMSKRTSAALGSVTALLGMVYTTMLGYALITCGIYTFEMVKSGDANYNDEYDYIGLMLVGSFIACLFWGLTVALWPWYTDEDSCTTTAKDTQTTYSSPLSKAKA